MSVPAREARSFGASKTWFLLEGGLLLGRQGICNFYATFSILLYHFEDNNGWDECS